MHNEDLSLSRLNLPNKLGGIYFRRVNPHENKHILQRGVDRRLSILVILIAKQASSVSTSAQDTVQRHSEDEKDDI